VISSLIGGGAAFLGFYMAYTWDMPVGPTDVVLLGVVYAATWTVTRLLHGVLQRPPQL
jgi:ABC-type Mn2+/Zn2+ transport system permease subunit